MQRSVLHRGCREGDEGRWGGKCGCIVQQKHTAMLQYWGNPCETLC